jgi:hypothetical protein
LDEFHVCIMSKCNDMNSSCMWNAPTNIFKSSMIEWNNWMEVHVVWSEYVIAMEYHLDFYFIP